jgi:arylsulfatase A-like enzyme
VIDGVDLMPFLTGKTTAAPHEVLRWRNGENAAVRKGQWKLFKGGTRYWLFDLSTDVGEKKDLAAERPDVVEQLKTELTTWEAQLKAPLWPCRAPGGTFEVDGVKLNICV